MVAKKDLFGNSSTMGWTAAKKSEDIEEKGEGGGGSPIRDGLVNEPF